MSSWISQRHTVGLAAAAWLALAATAGAQEVSAEREAFVEQGQRNAPAATRSGLSQPGATGQTRTRLGSSGPGQTARHAARCEPGLLDL